MATLLSYALTTLADVKESLGIDSSDHSWDNLIIRKINQATRQIESYCNRHFLETTYTNEEYDATGTNQLILKQRPITNTATFSLGYRNTSLNDDDWQTSEVDRYFVDDNSGVVNSTFGFGGSWNRWRVTYSAGYATIPEDLAEAAATLASYYVLNPDGSQIGIQEKQEGQRRVRYLTGGKNGFAELLAQLGIDQIINSYANFPILADI